MQANKSSVAPMVWSQQSMPVTDRLKTEVFGPDSRPNGFIALADEWNALLEKSRCNTVFLTHEWQSTWWRMLGEGELWIVALRERIEGRLVGIAPFYLIRHESGELAGKLQLNLVGCIEVSDYLDIIADKEWEDAVYDGLVEWLTSSEAPAWDILDLCNLPEDSRTYRVMADKLQVSGMVVRVFQEDVAPQFPLQLRYETYLQEQVDKKQRHEIRRKQRRAEREADVGFYFVGAKQNLEAEVDDFIALQRASRTDKSDFMSPDMHRFFVAMSVSMQDAGWLRLCFLTLNGEKAASLIAFEYDGHFLLYNSGYNPDAYAQLSPGWVILSYAIQYAIATGCHRFDFMQGNEEYKYRFGALDYRVMRVIASRPA
jgi:CelD/BcsL family acetyltransferase involved in cellulose biosynthesis